MNKLLPLILIFTIQIIYSQKPQGNREQGQKPIVITGKVLGDDTKEPLEYATLVLQSVEEPEKVTGGITDVNGVFNVETVPGKYNISIEYISFKTYELKNQTINSSKDLGTISLVLDVAQLEAVEVIGEKTTVEVRLDKKIYNIGKDLTTSGATISDALNNVPSVDVDVEGTISLRGNENVRILINGRPSALAGFGSTDALRQLPAEAIEKVEVITSPSARYDAEGTAGILNIILRKEKTLGFNGSVNVNVGYPVNSGLNINANLRKEKYNLFTTVGYRYRDAPGNAFFDNTYASGSFDRIIEDRLYSRLDRSFNVNFGMEYFITNESSITGSFFYRTSIDEDVTDNTNQRFNDDELSSRTFRQELENEDDKNYQFSLNYINNFNDEGHKLTADFQFSEGKENADSEIEENETLPEQNLVVLEQVFEEETENEYLIQTDYVLPMGDAQFEAGYRGTFEENITDYRLDSLNQGTGQFDTNQDLTNIFTYNENVNALYTQYGNKLGKFSFLLGLRLENTQLKGQLESEFDSDQLEEELGVDVDVNFDKNYLGLFPTINLIYELAENENISLGYNRRINRPRGRYINPFPSRSSRTNIFQGNPDLDPAFSNAFDIGYLKRWDKLTLTSSIYYQKETNSFERVQEETGQTTTDGIEIVRSIPINLSTEERTGAEAGVLYNPTKWLRFNSSVNLFRFVTEGEFNGVDYGADNFSWFGRFGSKVSLPAKIDWQTNTFYRGPSQNAQTENEGILSVDLAFSKDILDDKATIALNVSDVLNGRIRKSFTETEFFTSRSEFQYRMRQTTVSFVYRFNQPKEKERSGRGDGNDEGDDEFDG